jgi:ABC-type Mn2+/Zn2+ transport system permease subunit
VGGGDALGGKRFQQDKKVLSLLLGVVTAVLGCYDVSRRDAFVSNFHLVEHRAILADL